MSYVELNINEVHFISSPAEGGSPTDEATKKFVSDVRDQLLQGLADNAETIR